MLDYHVITATASGKYFSIARQAICAVLVLLLVSACGSAGLYQKIVLDTPPCHVQNGMQFLSMNKIDTAMVEFNRAIELNSEYSPAYMGLGLAYGRLGDFKTAYQYMEKSRIKAVGHEQQTAAADGLTQLNHMKKTP
jgi:Tfp pilus assembly protein PilF